MSNNPPDIELALTHGEAAFLLRNCSTNIHFALNAMQNTDLSDHAIRQLVELNERFVAVRNKLKAAGVQDE